MGKEKENKKSGSYYDTASGLLNIRYTALLMSLTVDFIRHDLSLLLSSDNPDNPNDPNVIMMHIQSKLNYIDYLASDQDSRIRECFPPEGINSSSLLNRVCDYKHTPSSYTTASSPPLPFSDETLMTLSTYPTSFSTAFIDAKKRKLKALGLSDFCVQPEDDAIDGIPTIPAAASEVSQNINEEEQPNPTKEDYDGVTIGELMETYCQHVTEHKENNKTMSGRKFIKYLMEHKVIDFKEATFYRVLDKYNEFIKNGGLTEDFVWTKKDVGGNYYINFDEIDAELIPDDNDETLSLKKVIEKLTAIKKARAVAAGKAAHMIKDVCVKTGKKYMSDASASKKSKIRKSVRYKDDLRCVGERSIMSTVTFSNTVSASHYVITDDVPAYAKKLPKIKDATKGARDLYELVQKCNPGKVVSPVHPALITSTDDSTVYALAGTESDTKEWVLENAEAHNNSTYSSFSNDEDKNINLKGRRVRITTTISASGAVAPLFITIYGLTERDLPRSEYPDGIYVAKFEGLCIGGNQDPFCTGFGFVCFCRKKDPRDRITPDHAAYSKGYRFHCQKPFSRKMRQLVFGGDADVNTASEELDECKVIVSWCDGGGPQVATLVDPEEVKECNLENIIANKHSKNRSAVEQPCDIAPCFMVLKKVSRAHTALDTPHNHLIERFTKRFNEIEENQGIYLGSHKKHLIDFLATVPSLYCKAMNPKNVTIGFIGCGMIDTETKTWPDLTAMMHTCKNTEVQGEHTQNLFKNNFGKMYEEQMKTGMLSDEFMEGIGFLQDRNMDGSLYTKKVSDHNEGGHRSKNFTHEKMAQKRDERVKQIQAEAEEKIDKAVSITAKYHSKNNTAETKIRSYLPPNITDMAKIELPKLYSGVSRELLYAFRYVRSFKTYKHNQSLRNPNRGTLEHVLAGGDSSTTLALKMFNKPVILETSEECGRRLRSTEIAGNSDNSDN